MSLVLDPNKDVLVPVKILKKFAGETFNNYEELSTQIKHHLGGDSNEEEAEKKLKDKKYEKVLDLVR